MQERTAQETFDTVVEHLRMQGGRAGSSGSCLYKADNGRKCAVGCLIPDDQYDAAMERRSAGAIIGEYPGLEHLKPHVDLLMALQEAHDDADDRDDRWCNAYRFDGCVPSGIAARLMVVANEYGLTFNYRQFYAFER